MKHPTQVIIRPVITQKSTMLRMQHNQYVFEVADDATKIDIKNAIRQLYNVDVVKVRTMWVKPKPKRFGIRSQGHTKAWKKAIVTLKPNQTIEDFNL
ncbi:MAG: 50S ribosomal protein L23 [Fimbriimonadales bacterium]|nr:50S ribosomal protein L23 [Fimbriimonadales bacterium]MDW8051352.1 50S ribosomal protein L23 [Armatimonadota bacterium]